MFCVFWFLPQDTTFEFERKRNRPERYDRDRAKDILQAIKTIDKVRSHRAEMHIKKRYDLVSCGEDCLRYLGVELFAGVQINVLTCVCRMKKDKRKEQEEARKELEQGIPLVKAPSVLQEEPSLTLPKVKVKASQAQQEEHHAMEE